MARRSLIAGNWKMYKTPLETVEFVAQLLKRPEVTGLADRDVLICAPFPCLPALREAASGSVLKTGAQNCFYEEEGAFTGEVSVRMLVALGIGYVLCGHSERRHIFGETDEVVNRKVRKVLDAGLYAVLCIGETLEQREREETFTVVKRQLDSGLRDVSDAARLVVAYEPVWAIGTGRNATASQAQEVHRFVRERLSEKFPDSSGDTVVLYGGSVKPENIDSLMAEPDIDGCLVGGASLKVESFARIIAYRS